MPASSWSQLTILSFLQVGIAECKRSTRLERCALWSTTKFQRCSLRHITAEDINRATKATTHAAISSEDAVVSEVIVPTMRIKVIVATVYSNNVVKCDK
jgi:hypothetical protein